MKLSFQFRQWVMLVKFICFLFCAAVMSKPQQLTDNQKTLILTCLWPPGYCKTRNCHQTPKNFVVGELRQKSHSEKGSIEVPNTIFDKYGDDLNRVWPDLSREKKEEVEKEYYIEKYEREGAYCLEMDADKYFGLATSFARIHLHHLLHYMIESGFKPNDDASYFPAILALNIETYSEGHSVGLVCEKHGGRYYLVAIHFCLKTGTLQLVDCHGVIDPLPSHTCMENGMFVVSIYFANT